MVLMHIANLSLLALNLMTAFDALMTHGNDTMAWQLSKYLNGL